MSYDIMIKSQIKSLVPRSQSKFVVSEMMSIPEVKDHCEVIPPIILPDEDEVYTLDEVLLEDEVNQQEFDQFCESQKIANDVKNKESASAFLDWIWGTDLCLISLPSDENLKKEVLEKILLFAKSKDYVVHDPQLGEDIKL